MATSTPLSSAFDGEIKEIQKMSLQQRSVVDNRWEEGHYESGIQVLNKLRSPQCTPSVAHIRQLIYMALYPPALPLEVFQKKQNMSPRKLNARRERRAIMPSNEASRQATNLLIAFAHTNSSESLLCAIPSYYEPSSSRGVRFRDAADQDENIKHDLGTSATGKEARLIGQVKDCWEILKPRLVTRKDDDGYSDDDSDDDAGIEDVMVKKKKLAVGSHSWGMLEFFVRIFEHDQNSSKPGSKRSALRTQTPYSTPGQPWDVDRPLNVIFAAISPCKIPRSETRKKAQEVSLDPYRAGLGLHLLSLVVHETLVDQQLNPEGLISSSIRHMNNPSLPVANFAYLLSTLPSTEGYARFKLTLLVYFLDQSSLGVAMSIPQNKVKPRAKTTNQLSTDSTPQPADPSETNNATTSTPSYPIPPMRTLLHRLSIPTASDPSSPLSPSDLEKSAIAKLHILIALSQLFGQSSEAENTLSKSELGTRQEFITAVSSHEVRGAVQRGFGEGSSSGDGNGVQLARDMVFGVLDDLEAVWKV